jgi:hypothetical protein
VNPFAPFTTVPQMQKADKTDWMTLLLSIEQNPDIQNGKSVRTAKLS